MILQRIRIIVVDAGFEPGTSAPEVWRATNEPPHLLNEPPHLPNEPPQNNIGSTGAVSSSGSVTLSIRLNFNRQMAVHFSDNQCCESSVCTCPGYSYGYCQYKKFKRVNKVTFGDVKISYILVLKLKIIFKTLFYIIVSPFFYVLSSFFHFASSLPPPKVHALSPEKDRRPQGAPDLTAEDPRRPPRRVSRRLPRVRLSFKTTAATTDDSGEEAETTDDWTHHQAEATATLSPATTTTTLSSPSQKIILKLPLYPMAKSPVLTKGDAPSVEPDATMAEPIADHHHHPHHEENGRRSPRRKIPTTLVQSVDQVKPEASAVDTTPNKHPRRTQDLPPTQDLAKQSPRNRSAAVSSDSAAAADVVATPLPPSRSTPATTLQEVPEAERKLSTRKRIRTSTSGAKLSLDKEDSVVAAASAQTTTTTTTTATTATTTATTGSPARRQRALHVVAGSAGATDTMALPKPADTIDDGVGGSASMGAGLPATAEPMDHGTRPSVERPRRTIASTQSQTTRTRRKAAGLLTDCEDGNLGEAQAVHGGDAVNGYESESSADVDGGAPHGAPSRRKTRRDRSAAFAGSLRAELPAAKRIKALDEELSTLEETSMELHAKHTPPRRVGDPAQYYDPSTGKESE